MVAVVEPGQDQSDHRDQGHGDESRDDGNVAHGGVSPKLLAARGRSPQGHTIPDQRRAGRLAASSWCRDRRINPFVVTPALMKITRLGR